MSKRALILGVGQDGSYLAELLLGRGYEVHLMHRRSSVDNLWRVRHLLDRITLHRGDMCDSWSLYRVISRCLPDELYNEADQDDARWSESLPWLSLDVTLGGVMRVLETVKEVNSYEVHNIKVFQPLSCLMFGDGPPPQSEATPLKPMSPYAVAKAAAWHLCQHYRREHGVDVRCGIMFNHDSPNRSGEYALHKVCRYAARIAAGRETSIPLGNVEQRFDVGFAGDYMDAAHRIMQLERPDDYCVGSGVDYSIGEMWQMACIVAGVDGDTVDWDNRIVTDPTHWKPITTCYRANCGKLWTVTGWEPKVTLPNLIRMMVDHELKKL